MSETLDVRKYEERMFRDAKWYRDWGRQIVVGENMYVLNKALEDLERTGHIEVTVQVGGHHRYRGGNPSGL